MRIRALIAIQTVLKRYIIDPIMKLYMMAPPPTIPCAQVLVRTNSVVREQTVHNNKPAIFVTFLSFVSHFTVVIFIGRFKYPPKDGLCYQNAFFVATTQGKYTKICR